MNLFSLVLLQALHVGGAHCKHVFAIEKAAGPLRHVDSSLREGVAAYKDREQLYGVSAEVKQRIQEKRQRHRTAPSEVSL